MDELLRGLRPLRSWGPLLALLVLAWSLAGLAGALRRAWSRRVLLRRMARARAGEVRAAALLEAQGYRVVAGQIPRELVLLVDGVGLRYLVRADFLVEDGRGERFLAEVKTGALASDPLYPPTRRQLLEYGLGFPELAGVLLVDVERGRVRLVRFAGPA